MLENNPAWQDEQTASDDRFAPAPTTPRSGLRTSPYAGLQRAHACVCCYAIPAVLYVPGEQGDPLHSEVPAERGRKWPGRSSDNFSSFQFYHILIYRGRCWGTFYTPRMCFSQTLKVSQRKLSHVSMSNEPFQDHANYHDNGRPAGLFLQDVHADDDICECDVVHPTSRRSVHGDGARSDHSLNKVTRRMLDHTTNICVPPCTSLSFK
jgi:hypothetical protein